ncbi:hypothetical protein K7C98_10315 [Nannocystis pusilla]|uniref:Uncharacterized protein n=1 Tax=Nannocystis pusilla TaxID=889268 RepID=A0ABS7TN53_9BACT|nr:hypothetical protein [Nannocystis pusilla]
MAPTPASTAPLGWDNVLPLPTAADVKGDLMRNWGKTPQELRPLLLLAEEVSGIVGAGRILSIVAYRESGGWIPTAHNGDDPAKEAAERDASLRAYNNSKDRNKSTPLVYAQAAANFGSGGLYGALAPYFLWTGVQEMKDKAPLLGSDPRIMFLPRVATFGAIVYLQRLLDNYTIADHYDIKAGWASPSLLVGTARGNATYKAVRQRFAEDVAAVGIDLNDTTTIPAQLSAAKWPGVATVFQKIVGTLPTPRKSP